MKNISFILFCLLTNLVFSQKKIIDHTVYNSWKTKSDVNISNDGKFTSYIIKPHKGDGFLYLINNETGKKDSIFRANMPRFTADSKVMLFKITPGFDTLRKCELNKVKKDKWPKDSLGVWFLANDSLLKFPKMKEFVVSEEGSTFAYLSHENKSPLDVIKGKKKKKWFKKAKEVEEIISDGNLLSIFNTDGKSKSYLKNVTAYVLSENGEKLVYITHQKNKVDSSKISVFDLKLKKDFDLNDKYISIQHAKFDKTGNKLIYLASQDTAKDAKVYQLSSF
jgi:hypothetical protein